jgi:acyl-homoserine lactone acylase PvdQ
MVACPFNWTDEYEWTGYIPFEEMPSAFNPPEGDHHRQRAAWERWLPTLSQR